MTLMLKETYDYLIHKMKKAKGQVMARRITNIQNTIVTDMQKMNKKQIELKYGNLRKVFSNLNYLKMLALKPDMKDTRGKADKKRNYVKELERKLREGTERSTTE